MENDAPTRKSAVIAAVLWAVFVIGAVVNEAINLALPWNRMPSYLNTNDNEGIPALAGTFAMVAFVSVGALLVWRRPRHRVGWLLCAIPYSAIIPLGSFQTYLGLGWHLHPGTYPPGADWLYALSSATWWIPFTLIMVVLPLIFPVGRLPSQRWRVVFVAGALYGIAFLVFALNPDLGGPPGLRNPLAVPALKPIFPVLQAVFLPLMSGCLVAAIGSLVVRYRRAASEERHQIKWVVATVGAVTVLFLVQGLVPAVRYAGATPMSIGAIPIAIGIAIFRYRLYDIDIVLNRSLVFAALAAFIAGIYIVVVVGVGRLVGAGNRPNLLLSILATALVAIAFQPVRERVEAIANRLVYGQRLSPYEALTGLAQRFASGARGEEVLTQMARVLAQGTAAERATVWLKVGPDMVPSTTWPQGGEPVHVDADRRAPVHHQGQLLGELAVKKPAGEALTSVEEGLLADMSAQAGLVLHNVALDAELRRRLEEISKQTEELRESRQRIVAAQDLERRRLERNIHDGAQQHLVALAVKLRLAATLSERNAEKAQAMLAQLKADAVAATHTLRELASGIYPPSLAERGIAGALRTDMGELPFRLHVDAESSRRYAVEVEAAVYFCCLEALQNVSKYAGAENASVHIAEHDGQLEFEVRDDGNGFDAEHVTFGSGLRNLNDRVEALGGIVTVTSRPGEGTTVAGRLPLGRLEPVR